MKTLVILSCIDKFTSFNFVKIPAKLWSHNNQILWEVLVVNKISVTKTYNSLRNSGYQCFSSITKKFNNIQI
jgi:hypothetical protein